MFKSPFFVILTLLIVATPQHTHAQWEQANGLYTGPIYSLTANETYLFAGGGTVCRSTNSGVSWQLANSGLPTNTAFGRLFPYNNYLFAGTNTRGVYRSTDNGSSWIEANSGLPSNTYIGSFTVSGNTIFAGTGANGVYRSTDNGTTWQSANNGQGNGGVYSLASNGTHIFAGGFSSGSGVGVYVSTDNGDNWTATTNPFTTNTIAISGTYIFAGTAGNGVYLSTDNGANWAPAGLTGSSIQSIVISGSNIFAGSSGIHRSTNNGASWTNLTIQSNSVSALAANGTDLFAGTSGTNSGVFRSTDNGENWQVASPGLTNRDVRAFIQKGNSTFAGTYGGGVFRSSDNGTNWQGASLGISYPYMTCFLVNGTDLFAGTGIGVFRSTDDGNGWNATSSWPYTPITSLVAIGNNLFAGTDGSSFGHGVLLSTNNGANWTPVNSNLPFNRISSLAVIGSSLFASNYWNASGVYVSTDNGTNWTEANSGFGIETNVLSLGVGGSSIFAVTNNYGGVFRSTNYGTSWTRVDTGLQNTIITSFTASGSILFTSGLNVTGQRPAVFVSHDNGDSWGEVSQGLPMAFGYVGNLAGSGEYMFCSDANGAWRRPLSEMTLSEVQLISPGNNSHQPLNTTLRWGRVLGADFYTAQVATDPSFTNIIVSDSTLSDTTRTIGPLADNTQHYWRVRARSTTLGGPFSPVWSFAAVGSPPNQVSPYYPEHGASINADTVDCYWYDPGTFVTHYWFERALDSLFTSPLIDSTITTTHTVSRDLVSSTTYWWRVRAKNIAGWGPYSDPRNFVAGGLATVFVNIAQGWNMISNPVTRAANSDSVRQLYPFSSFEHVFGFNPGGGYFQRFTMPNGSGFWGKFPEAVLNSITGEPRTIDSINVAAGWNMVGSISSSVDTSTIVTVPAGIRSSNWFGYSGGYSPATQILPGQAYWVKANAPGKFVFAAQVSPPLMASDTHANDLDWFNTLAIADADGHSQTLYFGNDPKGMETKGMYEMPPMPPIGAFDARFETEDGGSIVRTHALKVTEALEFPVTIQSESYPLTVTWNVSKGMAAYELTDGLGGQAFLAKSLAGEGSIKITIGEVTKLFVKLVSDGQLAKEFSLAQNYPNPFNPTTAIRYHLPEASHVSLKIFNILGQEVATLVNEEQKAGYRSVEWNASIMASGVYFYRLQAGEFTQTKKLLLLK